MRYPIDREISGLSWALCLAGLFFFSIFLMLQIPSIGPFWRIIFATLATVSVISGFMLTGFSVKVYTYESMLEKRRSLEKKIKLNDDDLLKATGIYVCGDGEGVKINATLLFDAAAIRVNLKQQLEKEELNIHNYENSHGKFVVRYKRLVPEKV